MHQAPKTQQQTVVLYAEWHKRWLRVSLPYSCWVQRSCVTPIRGTCPYSWKHTASFPGFEGNMAAPNSLQKKDLEQQQLLLLHLLLEAMASPAQLVVYVCSSVSLKSWPSLFKLSQRWVLSEFSLQVIRYTGPRAKGKPSCFCRKNSNFLTYSSLMTRFLWLILGLLRFWDGEEERGQQPTGSRFFPWLPQP